MGILFERLLIILNENHSDSTFYHIAMIMLTHVEKLSRISINELADLCSVSKSTISKFVREIGYDDYSDFRYAAVFQENKYGTETNFLVNVLSFIEKEGYGRYMEAVTADLKASYEQMDWEAMARLAKDLTMYDKAAAFGMAFSETAAIDLQRKLAYCRKFIITNMDDQKQMDYIREAGEDTLLIIFSDSGKYLNRYKEIIDFGSKDVFDRTKAKVVLITADEAAARDRRVSYSILYRRTDVLHTHRILYQMITDVIAFLYYQETRKNKRNS